MESQSSRKAALSMLDLKQVEDGEFPPSGRRVAESDEDVSNGALLQDETYSEIYLGLVDILGDDKAFLDIDDLAERYRMDKRVLKSTVMLLGIFNVVVKDLNSNRLVWDGGKDILEEMPEILKASRKTSKNPKVRLARKLLLRVMHTALVVSKDERRRPWRLDDMAKHIEDSENVSLSELVSIAGLFSALGILETDKSKTLHAGSRVWWSQKMIDCALVMRESWLKSIWESTNESNPPLLNETPNKLLKEKETSTSGNIAKDWYRYYELPLPSPNVERGQPFNGALVTKRFVAGKPMEGVLGMLPTPKEMWTYQLCCLQEFMHKYTTFYEKTFEPYLGSSTSKAKNPTRSEQQREESLGERSESKAESSEPEKAKSKKRIRRASSNVGKEREDFEKAEVEAAEALVTRGNAKVNSESKETNDIDVNKRPRKSFSQMSLGLPSVSQMEAEFAYFEQNLSPTFSQIPNSQSQTQNVYPKSQNSLATPDD